MPKMHCHEILRVLKENNITEKIPLIFISSDVDSEAIEKGMELGACAFIKKTFSPWELFETLSICLKDE